MEKKKAAKVRKAGKIVASVEDMKFLKKLKPRPKHKTITPPPLRIPEKARKQPIPKANVTNGKPLEKGIVISARPFHPVPKPEPRRKQSTIYAAVERVFHQLVNYLKVERAHYVCEICGGRIHLQGAHIIKRAQGRLDHIENIIIACQLCHDHWKYGESGLPVSVEVAQRIVRERNAEIGLEQISITETACILSRNGIRFNVMEMDEYD